MTRRIRRRNRGATLVELLMAALLLSVGLMGLVNIWLFSFRVTVNTDEMAIAYTIGRDAIERLKYTGFKTAEGTTVSYYDATGQLLSGNTSAARFQVTRAVVSDAVNSGTAGQAGAVPNNYALRMATVTVTKVGSATTLYQTRTYLVRAGI